jgi:hypothetical protein
MTVNLSCYIAAVIALFSAVVRLVAARTAPPNTTRRLLTAAIAVFGVSLALTAQPTLAAANNFDPFPNATRLVANLLWMVSAFFLVSMSAYTDERRHAARQVRRYGIVLICAATTMVVLLINAHTHSTDTFASEYGREPRIAAYLMIFYLYSAWAQIRLIALVWRFANAAGAHTFVCRGVQLTFIAAGLMLAWLGWEAIELGFLIGRDHVPPAQFQLMEYLSPTAMALGAVGCAFATLATYIGRYVTSWRTRLAIFWLRPLWTALVSAQPQVLLPLTAVKRTPEYHLYRKLVEIRDAQIALVGYVPSDLPNWAADISAENHLSPIRTRQVTEAACLLAALRAQKSGRRPHGDPSTSAVAWPTVATVPRPLDEAAWLIGMHRAMRRDRLVGHLCRRVRQSECAEHASSIHSTHVACPPDAQLIRD